MGVKRNSTASKAQIPCNIHCLIWVATIGLALLFCSTNSALGGPQSPSDISKPTIVLDPGHGGRNHGAQGPSELLEKTVCLSLARDLATRLEAGGYKVVLTRSDDYDVPLRNRTAIANHNEADLFLSIHTAASYQHAAQGITIHRYRPPNNRPASRDPSAPTRPSQIRAWRQIQLGYEPQSRNLAETLARAMEVVGQSAMIQVSQSPLVVLEGADMAAVLIEIGYLTHPETEKNLGNRTYMATMVDALAQGIDTYFATRPRSQTK